KATSTFWEMTMPRRHRSATPTMIGTAKIHHGIVTPHWSLSSGSMIVFDRNTGASAAGGPITSEKIQPTMKPDSTLTVRPTYEETAPEDGKAFASQPVVRVSIRITIHAKKKTSGAVTPASDTANWNVTATPNAGAIDAIPCMITPVRPI